MTKRIKVQIDKGKSYPMFETECTTAGLHRPYREYKFCSTRKWMFDFAWPMEMIALEIEGGAFYGPGHRSVGKFLRDIEKYNEAAVLGWRVLRCTTADVSSGSVFSLLKRVLLHDLDRACQQVERLH